jgi:UDP-glucose 4-epimerase
VKNVLVNGATSVLGRALLCRLRAREEVKLLFGFEHEPSSDWLDGAELLPFPDDHRGLVALLAEYSIDTVMHCDLAPDRSGSQFAPSEARVIDTMRLGAGIASADGPARSWVIASSSSVYPVSSQAPRLHRETSDLEPGEGTLAASILEAEEYARDVAGRCPHLNVAILRLQHLVGAGVRGPLAALLRQPVIPKVLGFDPSIQMLAIEDAVAALVFAADLELAGVYNLASAGTIRASELADRLGKPSLPVVPLQAGSALGGLARRFGVPHVPEGLLDTLCYGHSLDTDKFAIAGFEPRFDQTACLEQLRDERSAGGLRSLVAGGSVSSNG